MKKQKPSVLFVCIHNSARSRMAEAFLKELGRNNFEVTSAGLEVGQVNPLAVQAMAELGLDIQKNRGKDIHSLLVNKGQLLIM